MWFLVIFYDIFGDFFIGTGEPPPYCDKIPTKSPFCMVVVLKSWDWVRPPTPRWDKIPTLVEICFEGSPLLILSRISHQNIKEYYCILCYVGSTIDMLTNIVTYIPAPLLLWILWIKNTLTSLNFPLACVRSTYIQMLNVLNQMSC